MASRKEEKERLRRERLAAERREHSGQRRRMLIGYLVAGLLAAVVIAGIVVAILAGGDEESAEVNEAAGIAPHTGIVPAGLEPDEREGSAPPPVEQADLERAAEAADCELRLNLQDEGNAHLGRNEDPPAYETSPPTSGDHDPEPLADGAYRSYPEPRNFVHSLEHGRVQIQYDPELPEREQLELKGVFDEDRAGLMMFPNPEMPWAVAVTGWTNKLACESYNPQVPDAVRAFRDTFRGQGPEAVGF